MSLPPHDFACIADTPTAELIKFMCERGPLARSAYEIICKQYQPIIWKRLINMSLNNADAQNITQEAFVRLWVHSREQPLINVEAWTWKVAKNMALDLFNSATHRQNVSLQEKRRDEDGNSFSLEDTLLSEDISVEDEVCGRIVLQDAFRQLSISQLDQKLFVMFHRDKYQQSELAKTFGLSIDQVQRRISVTRRQLHNYLQNDFGKSATRKEPTQ